MRRGHQASRDACVRGGAAKAAFEGTVDEFVAANPRAEAQLYNRVKQCGHCRKVCAYTLATCNGCGADLASVDESRTPNVFMGFAHGIARAGFPLRASTRLETEDVLVFDDPLVLAGCHVCAIPTDVHVPTAAGLFADPARGAALMRRLEAAAWAAVEALVPGRRTPGWPASTGRRGRPTRRCGGPSSRASTRRRRSTSSTSSLLPPLLPRQLQPTARGTTSRRTGSCRSTGSSRPSTRSRPRASPSTRTWTAPSSSRASRPSAAGGRRLRGELAALLRRRRGVADGARPLRARALRLRRARRGHARAGPRERRRGDGRRRRRVGERGQGRARRLRPRRRRAPTVPRRAAAAAVRQSWFSRSLSLPSAVSFAFVLGRVPRRRAGAVSVFAFARVLCTTSITHLRVCTRPTCNTRRGSAALLSHKLPLAHAEAHRNGSRTALRTTKGHPSPVRRLPRPRPRS